MTEEEDTLAGIVLRPPNPSWNGAELLGPRAATLDNAGSRHWPGLVRVVLRESFVGIVATSAASAEEAAMRLRVTWTPSLPAVGPTTNRTLWQRGVRRATDAAPDLPALERRYRWPTASPVDSERDWAVASWTAAGLAVWIPGEETTCLRQSLVELAHCPLLIFASGGGRSATSHAIDAAADAALLSREVGRPVRVRPRLDPAAQVLYQETRVRAEFDPRHRLAVHAMLSSEAPWQRPSMAALLARVPAAGAASGVRVVYPYAAVHAFLEMPLEVPVPRSLDQDFSFGQVFAQECFMDEAAAHAAHDPAEFRLAHLSDARATSLVRAVCEQAGWNRPLRGGDARRRVGRGIACAQAQDQTTPSGPSGWSVWIAEVAIDPAGAVDLTRVVVGHDAGDLRAIAPDSVRMENFIRGETRGLLQQPAFDAWPGVSGTAVLPGSAATAVELIRGGAAPAPDGAIAWSGWVTLPAAAAIANAIFDATGVRLREPPFQSPSTRAALSSSRTGTVRDRIAGIALGAVLGAGACLASLLPWRAPLAPLASVSGLYSAEAVERGRLIASVGACAACHTSPGGPANAGGRALHTPFGTVYSTNITPDPDTGIGRWSYEAFERAMRQGIHRDGRHLYPAFPYTAFARLSAGDMQALYAYVMSGTPVVYRAPATALAFPFNFRSLMAGWNLLFHDAEPYRADPLETVEWNRGRYLVDGAGHCGACHTPRNRLGAEKRGDAYLAGGEADGWDAPALNAASVSPLPWSIEDLYGYLRGGSSVRHGAAAGPMSTVITELAPLADGDIKAMAVYLASLNPAAASSAPDALALERAALPQNGQKDTAGERLFEGACAACHEAGQGASLFGSGPSLAFNTNLRLDRPDNVLRVILEGIPAPAHGNLGQMPGFAASLDDAQIRELLDYLRARFAPEQPAWKNSGRALRRIRASASGQVR